jgi:hypothetical protein
MIDVKVSHIDTSMASKGARSLRVRISSNVSFETPVRPISHTELTAKSFLGYRGEIQAPISALPVNLNSGDRFERFLRNNGMVNETRRKLQSMSDSTHMCPSFSILQTPPLNPENKLPFKIAFDMQCSVEDMDYICIPVVESGENLFESIVTDWCESAEDNFDKGAVPQIRMDEDPALFSKKLNVLCELSKTGMVPVINVVYANPNKNSIQFAELWSRREDLNAIVNCSEVPAKGREFYTGVNADLEEYLIQHGVDSITRRKYSTSPIQIYARIMAEPPTDLEGVDDYTIAVHSAGIRISGNLWRSTEHPLLCSCSVCRGDSRDKLVERFAYKDNGDIEQSGLSYYSKIHDHQSDQLELNDLRKYIRSSELKEYDEQLELKRSTILNSLRPLT